MNQEFRLLKDLKICGNFKIEAIVMPYALLCKYDQIADSTFELKRTERI